ncbi:VOC family protein [Puniceibacterium sp. IMCC21224]|uniref:VOC family protein n=1 Tax=Puniceibacterium sp. IMCC21224 TaxID=1618204 RepID=UPI00064DC70E|nr:VOC family protein [Puniceibacterium sp. IMCC21224]KMK67680.1 Glyoxalase-like domain [Puniceibacterium sp. IMCC21224]
MLKLDHIAVLGETLEEGTALVEGKLGAPLHPGGKHPHFATHNALIGVGDGQYIEVIANDPAAPPPPYARWFGLDTFKGVARLDKWICRVPDMAAALAALPMAGRPVALSRGTLNWVMSVPDDGLLPFDGLFPALIEWQSPVPPGYALPEAGWRLGELEICHPEAEALRALLTPHLDEPRVQFRTTTTPGLAAHLRGANGAAVVL